MIKVSIVIPVYNVERYLKQCIESAMDQTMRDIEIICVNDGSTDGSPKILREMAEKDGRIRVIDKPNSGYGNTMNIGIDLAKGKYVIFLESDDHILPELCEVLFGLCERYDLEIIKTDHYKFKEGRDGSQVYAEYMRASCESTDYGYNKVLSPQDHPVIFRYAMYTWSCMYNRDYLNKYKIRHNETPGASYQDNGFWFQTLMYCKRMYVLDQAFYMYRQDNPDSSIYSKEKVYAFSDEYQFIRKKIIACDLDKDKKKMLLRIAAYFDLKLNMISLSRVDRKYTEGLIALILKKFAMYRQDDDLSVKEYDMDFIRKLMICLAEPAKLKNEIWEYMDKIVSARDFLERYNTYLLYGAGQYARRCLGFLEECRLQRKTLLCGVTSIENADNKIKGVEIRTMDELLRYKDTALVILCAKKGTKNHEEMCHNLNKWGVKDFIDSSDLMIDDFWTF